MKLLFNPLLESFTYTWFNDKDEVETITLPSLEITRLEDAPGEYMARHLADKVYQEKYSTRNDRDEEYKKIYKEIYVTDELE